MKTASLWVCVLVVAAGCGAEQQRDRDDDDSSITTGTGGSGAAGGAGGAAGDEPALKGSIVMWSGNYGAAESYIGASFDALPTSCQTERLQECRATVCPLDQPRALQSAGVITITGGLQSPVTLTPQGNGEYVSNHDPTMPLYSGSELLTVSAEGAMLPGFDVTLTAPATATLVGPSESPIVIDTSSEFAVDWSGGSGSVVLVFAGVDESAGLSREVACFYDAEAQHALVPAGTLASLVGTSDSLWALVTTDEQIVAPDADWAVRVAASSMGKGSYGYQATPTAEFQ